MSQDSSIVKLVERQMRNWELARRQQPRFVPDQPERQVADFVTISRQVAAGGSAVGELVGQRLGWPVFDKEILHHMAGNDEVRARLYEDMDERDANWLESALRWLVGGPFRLDDYFHRLSETVLALARQGPGVFLGRGADLILPQDRGLRVRLLAPHEARVRQFALRQKCDEKEALAQIRRIELDRETFLRNHFRKERDDPTRFDLLLNLGRVAQDEAVELIVAALRHRTAHAG